MAHPQMIPEKRSISKESPFEHSYLEASRCVATNPDDLSCREHLAKILRENLELPRESNSRKDRAWLIQEQCALSFLNPLDQTTLLRRRKLQALVARYRETRYFRPVTATNRVNNVRNWDFRLGCVESLELEPVHSFSSFTKLSVYNPVRHIHLEDAPHNASQLLSEKPVFPKLAGLLLRNCGLNDDWIRKFSELEWSQQIVWLSLSRNRGITAGGIRVLAERFEALCYVELSGIEENPIAAEDGFVPRAGCELENALGRRVPWIHNDSWLGGVVRPTTLDLLDSRLVGRHVATAGV